MGRAEIAFVQLLWDIMNRRTGALGKVTFHPQKPPFDFAAPLEQPFPRSTPEAQGIDSAYLASFVQALGECRQAHLHQLMVLRHGHVIYEGGFDPYPTGIWHVTYSMCKSFTGMAIGLLIDDGVLSLEDRVTELLEKRFGPLPLLGMLRFRDLTVRHLLTMSSGAVLNEVGAISGDDWVRRYFEAGVRFSPGAQFEYNSMNSFILSAIVTEKTGLSMFEFLKKRLFAPMGIRKVFWESSPTGVTKAGWGMYLMQEDAAKLGMLYLQHGLWNGQRLLSERWVTEATRLQIRTGQEENPGYGYHLWMDCRPGSYCYNGMLGQNVHVYPDIDMVLVTNAGNEEVFQEGAMTGIVRRFFGPTYQPSAAPLPENRAACEALRSVRARMTGADLPRTPVASGGWPVRSTGRDRLMQGAGCGMAAVGSRLHQRASQAVAADFFPGMRAAGMARERRESFLCSLDGRVYRMKSAGVGLMPLLMQVVHTNYTRGISRLRFVIREGAFWLELTEGEQTHRLPVGFTRSRYGVVDLNGEEYAVGVRGRLGHNEDGIPVMSVEIAFVEEAAARLLKILFAPDGSLELQWNETPGDRMIVETLGMITTGAGNASPLMTGLLSQVSPEFIEQMMQSAIRPVVLAEPDSADKERG